MASPTGRTVVKMRSLYYSALVTSIAYRLHLSETCVNIVMNEMLHAITESLQEGRPVVIPGFGTFYTRERTAGQVPHGRTGKPVPFPAHRVAAFHAGDRLKRAVRHAERP